MLVIHRRNIPADTKLIVMEEDGHFFLLVDYSLLPKNLINDTFDSEPTKLPRHKGVDNTAPVLERLEDKLRAGLWVNYATAVKYHFDLVAVEL